VPTLEQKYRRGSKVTDDVENPLVKRALERIETGNLSPRQLENFYKNTLNYREISDLDRENLVQAIVTNLKTNHPREASKKFGAKDSEGRALLEKVYKEIKSEFDLSGNHVGNGIKVSGAQISGERYVGCYFSYKNSNKWNGGLYYWQDEVDSDPRLQVILFQTGKGNEGNGTERDYSVDDIDLAIEDLTNTLREIVD